MSCPPRHHDVFSIAVALIASVVPALVNAAPPSVSVSLVEGQAEVERAGSNKKSRLLFGAQLFAGDVLSTQDGGRLELTFLDRSRLRLGPNSRLTLEAIHFSGQIRERVSATLWVGRIWAQVAKAAGADASFEVETKNAVSGVRGTSFAVMAAADATALVRVYSGTVGVRKKPSAGGNRQQVPGPSPIDRAQWEEIVATAMKQVRISSLGAISPAEDFEDQGDDLKWASWNKERDAKP